MNGRLSTTPNFVFRCQKTNSYWVQLYNFVFRSQRANGLVGIVFKILYFALKKRISVWVQFLFRSKKRMAVWARL